MYASKVYKKEKSSKQFRKLLFYSCLIAIPVIHFALFYVYVNFSSILMAFRSYSINDEGLCVYNYSVDNLSNFGVAWDALTGDTNRLGNTFLYFFFHLIVNVPLALLSSYYLYKKKHASGFFKVMLFLPQVLSSIVLAVLYRYTVGEVYISLTGNPGLLTNPSTRLIFTMLFTLIMSFGVNVLIYTSAMSGINESIIESAQLDGCNSFNEFLKIVLPMIYPTVVTLLVVSISYFFVEQHQVYTLFEVQGQDVSNVGYYLYRQNLETDLFGQSTGAISTRLLSYPQLSAMGLILTAIILPITLFARWALNKFGPSTE